MKGSVGFALTIVFGFACSSERGALERNTKTPDANMYATDTQLTPATAADPPNSTPTAEEVRPWRSTIAGTVFDWTGDDLFVQDGVGNRSPVFSQIAQEYCRTLQTGPEQNCYCGHLFRLSSIVGTVFSFEHHSDFSCQGAYSSWRFGSMDAKKPGDFRYPRIPEYGTDKQVKAAPGKLIDLRNIFPESAIYAGLLNNTQVSSAIAHSINEGYLLIPPGSLDKLSKMLNKMDCGLGDGSLFLESDFLTRFVFHHLDADKVAVWISLSPNSHAGQANREHLEIMLPIPEKMRTALIRADSKQEGFLLKDAPEFVGTRYAEFEFQAGNAVKE
jgi:hypothetical protein